MGAPRWGHRRGGTETDLGSILACKPSLCRAGAYIQHQRVHLICSSAKAEWAACESCHANVQM